MDGRLKLSGSRTLCRASGSCRGSGMDRRGWRRCVRVLLRLRALHVAALSPESAPRMARYRHGVLPRGASLKGNGSDVSNRGSVAFPNEVVGTRLQLEESSPI